MSLDETHTRGANMSGRACTICTLDPAVRVAVEHAYVEGQPIARIARRYAQSPDALGRHYRRHLAPEMRSTASETRVVDLGSIAQRVASVADDARAAREAAHAAGRTADAVRAGDAELRALAMISDRMGIDDGATLAALAESDALMQAVAATVWDHPEFGRMLAERFTENNHDALADGITSLANRAKAAARPLTATVEPAPLAAITA